MFQDICREKGQLLMPDTFFAPILNSLLYMLVGRRFDNQELREIGRGIMRFLRSGDGTGGAITLAPWLRYIAPNFFGFTPIVEENKRFTSLFQVFSLDVNKSFFYFYVHFVLATNI